MIYITNILTIIYQNILNTNNPIYTANLYIFKNYLDNNLNYENAENRYVDADEDEYEDVDTISEPIVFQQSKSKSKSKKPKYGPERIKGTRRTTPKNNSHRT
jgi:hypothetical protein